MLFGSKKKSTTAPVENSGVTVMKLRDNIANQEKREAHLMARMEQLTIEAKQKKAKGDKRGALFAMKKRKLHENELAKIENVKMTLETQAISLEGATQNISTFDAMKTGNSAMKSIRKMFGVEKVDQLLDDTKDEMELQQEVNMALTQPLDPYLADDEDLLAELQALEAEDSKATMWPVAPSRPVKTPTKQGAPEPKKSKSKFALFA
ncbi:body protein 4B [Seminavis robusta]|uniref:Body protein 4B n=1 Tax=Seminavis robusta TaxID=568900 RepID=A0A9N8GZ97_9STRA|nr:body protein 4B [Seminavis robusta]|eukprot:Sro1_g000520.1 body protein 4B (207) ;mRNA; r:155514-156218